ncbi:MAG: F0F1 ATP synthase subunit delta [bacterium]|nr:F0F1 ATP synthase subunit delta [bacterium]
MKYSAKHYARALSESLRDAQKEEFSIRIKTFFGILRKHRALKLLPSILKIVEELMQGKGAEALVAKKLPQKTLIQIQKLFGTEYIVKEKTVPEVLGGMVLMWDDWRVDGSVRGKLQKLKSHVGK